MMVRRNNGREIFQRRKMTLVRSQKSNFALSFPESRHFHPATLLSWLALDANQEPVNAPIGRPYQEYDADRYRLEPPGVQAGNWGLVEVGMTDRGARGAVETVWRIESGRLIAGL